MALTDIKQLLPRDSYNAIVGANSPSASNVFATMLDLAGLGSGIYGGSGTLQVGDTTVTMAATDKLLFNSLNGPYDLFTIDAVNNRIGIGIASPGHTLHMVAGNMFIQDGVAAIGTTTPSAGQMLKISAGDSQISSSLLQGVRIDLSPLASAGALNAWGVDVRHDDARSGSGTKQFFMFDANYTGSSASAGTHTNYGIRSRATMTVGGTANVTNIGGYFEAANGTNNYAIQIVDGSQGLNKVLRSDANGVGTWVDVNTLVTAPNTLYTADGTVGAGRVATLTDTLLFSGGEVTIKGFGNTPGGFGLIVENLAGTDGLKVEDNGVVTLPNIQQNQECLVLGASTNKGGIAFNTGYGTYSKIYDRNDGTHNLGLSLQSRTSVFEFISNTGVTINAKILVGEISSLRTITGDLVTPLIIQGASTPNDANDGVRFQTADSLNAMYDRLQIEADNILPALPKAYFSAISGLGINTTAISSALTVNGDIETLTNTKGFVVLDRTNATRYRIYTDNGVLYTEAV